MESIQNSITAHSNIKMLIFPVILIVSLCIFTVPLLQTETKSLGSPEANITFSPDIYGHLRNLQQNNEFPDLPTSMNTIYRLSNYRIYKGKWKSEQEVFHFGDIREGQLIADTRIFTGNYINKEKISIYFRLLEGEFIDNWVDIRSQVNINNKVANINNLTFNNITKDYYSLERFYSDIMYGESIFNSNMLNCKY
jgi:hypothetical protein